MKIEKAHKNDLNEIIQLFKNAIIKMENDDIPQWDEIYPNEDILKEDIEKNQMYICKLDGKIASAFVLNQEFDEAYNSGKWKYPDSEFYIVHRLCVNPNFQNKGIGTKTMFLIEEFLKNQGAEAIRLDAFSLNPFATKMYEKIGYEKTGSAEWRKGLFYLYEKKL